MSQQQIQEINFRLECVKQNFKKIFDKLSPSGTSVKDLKLLLKENCCATCNHECIICREEDCLNKPSCLKLPCKECGCETKDCKAEIIMKSWIVFEEICKIHPKEVEDFIVNKVPLKGFPYCKTINQLLSTYMQNAVKTCSMYLLNKNQITKEDQLDSEMYTMMILRLPSKILQLSFPDVKFITNDQVEDLKGLAHQVEDLRGLTDQKKGI